MDDPRVLAFEMLIRRLEGVESAVARAERLLRDQAAAQDVRDVLMVCVTDLVHQPIRPHHRLYKLCERLEDLLHDAVDQALGGEEVVRRSVERLRELGANRITFLMLCQMSNMTDDIGAVLDAAEDRRLVPVEDALAFALHAEDLVSAHHQSDPDEQARLFERTESMVDRWRGHWETVGFKPGRSWSIGHY